MRDVVAAVAIALAGCGSEPGPSGACTVTDTPEGATISCPGSEAVTVKDGEDGSSRVVATYFCAGALEGTPLYFSYQVAQTTPGDVFAAAAIKGTAFDIGGSSYYGAAQVGAQTAAVIFTADVLGTANAGWWSVQLNRSTLVTALTYTDSDASGGSDSWTMLPAACVVNSF